MFTVENTGERLRKKEREILLKMEDFVKRVDNSWIRDLDENDEIEDNFPNQKSRQGTFNVSTMTSA